MSLSHKSFAEYANHVASGLDRYLATRRDAALEQALQHGFLLYSYVVEDCQAKATKNKDILDKTGVMLVEIQDVMRGIVHGMAAVSPVVLATMLRVAIEIRCNFKFIMTRDDPAKYADRYSRFGGLITLVHDNEAPNGPQLNPEQRATIIAASGEWISRKKDGSLRYDLNWTGDAAFASLKKIAREVGLANDYHTAYGATSQPVHGTARVGGLYADEAGGLHPIGARIPCKRLSYLGAMQCMRLVSEAAEFFGLPFDQRDYAMWRSRMLDACEDAN